MSVSMIKRKQVEDMDWWPGKENEAILLLASLWKEVNPDQLLLEMRKDDCYWCGTTCIEMGAIRISCPVGLSFLLGLNSIINNPLHLERHI